MGLYVGALVTIIAYSMSGGVIIDNNSILTEDSNEILTESGNNLLIES